MPVHILLRMPVRKQQPCLDCCARIRMTATEWIQPESYSSLSCAEGLQVAGERHTLSAMQAAALEVEGAHIEWHPRGAECCSNRTQYLQSWTSFNEAAESFGARSSGQRGHHNTGSQHWPADNIVHQTHLLATARTI